MIFNPGIMAATGAAGAVTGSYTGNGSAQKNLSLGFEPATILIMSSPDSGNNIYLLVAVNGAPKGLAFSSSSPGGSRIHVNFSDEGILVGSSADYALTNYNATGTVYNYVAIPKA